jgi:hypothetical protein
LPPDVAGALFDAVAVLLLLPHAARLSAASGTTAAAASKRIVLLMVMGCSMSIAGAPKVHARGTPCRRVTGGSFACAPRSRRAAALRLAQ